MKNKIISLLLSLTILEPCGVNNLNEVKISTNKCKYTCETSLNTEEKLNNYIINWSKKVYGIESVKEAINDASENAELNNIDNVEFILGQAEEVLPELITKGIKGNKLVVDPPRKGCELEVLESIVKLNPERVVYVSCNSTTMARDVKYLLENGYKVSKVQPVDMFPHTSHVESIILMTYCGSEDKN